MNSESLSATSMLTVGMEAPDFSLPRSKEETITLSNFRGKKNVVLAFVPYAFSDTCSAQLPAYEMSLNLFNDLNTQVLGISCDSTYALAEWAKQMEVSFPLLSDFFPHGKVTETYGILRPAGTPERALFVIDKSGIIRYIHVHRPIGEVPNPEEMFLVLSKLC